MTKCHIAYLACTAAVVGAGLGAAAPVPGHATLVVHPGQSIQKAVDAAAPGDTVLVTPGTYRESVRVTTPGLTLRGAGRGVVLEPATRPAAGTTQTAGTTQPAAGTTQPAAGTTQPAAGTTQPAAGTTQTAGTTQPAAGTTQAAGQQAATRQTATRPADPEKAAGKAAGKADGKADGKAAAGCAEAGNGICVEGTKDRRLEGVTITSLTVTGFARTGVSAAWTDRLTVRNVLAAKNGVWGIAEEHSRRSVFRANTARENGDAGLFLANTVTAEEGAADTAGTVVDRNRLEGNRIGVTVRRLRNVTVEHNRITGNCAGVFVVGDENKPKAGAVTVSGNRVERNNKSCPKTARLDALQGSGIVLTGVDDTVVTRNTVRDNAGASPLSGGIVIFKSFVGTPSERNRISDNVLSGNSPADLVDTDTGGKDNTFERNSCRASRPAGLC
ncbi:nitrous oxide reductase family maturation protein NosD [Streptomyces sp. NPDC003247]|uniref:right-handed parallel beta-helix repeat-containing protein n=1 Tax=Streptomyces sp. NPDC003247 TaxID=3364677 RepID=UPI00367BE1A6